MREITRFYAALSALLIALAIAPAAEADQSPAGCLGTPPTVSFSRQTITQTESPVRPGDSITLGARISNQGASACDLSGMSVVVRVPEPDGSPGDFRVIASSVSLAAGAAVEGFTEVPPYEVGLDDGLFEASLELFWTATVHDGDADRRIIGEGSSLEFRVTRPRASLTVVPDPLVGLSPLVATHTYLLTNDSPAPGGAPAPGIVPSGPDGARDLLADAACDPVTYLSGDSPSDSAPVLDPGESWKFTCTRAYLYPGTYSSQPSINGTSTVDGRAWPQIAAGDGITPLRVLGSDLVVDKSHDDDPYAGGAGTYSLLVTNEGNLATSGKVTVADQLPSGLTATSISGDGWGCELASLSCSRTDQLASGGSFPAVTVKVTTDADPPASVVNRASVSGGSETAAAATNNSDSDPTTIRSPGQPSAPAAGRFKVRQIKSRGNGSVLVKVTVPSAGKLTIDDARQPDLVDRVTRKVSAAGGYSVRVSAGQRLRRRLSGSPKSRRIRLKLDFRPPGGKKVSIVRNARFRLSHG